MPKYVILTDFLDFKAFLSILAEPQLIPLFWIFLTWNFWLEIFVISLSTLINAVIIYTVLHFYFQNYILAGNHEENSVKSSSYFCQEPSICLLLLLLLLLLLYHYPGSIFLQPIHPAFNVFNGLWNFMIKMTPWSEILWNFINVILYDNRISIVSIINAIWWCHAF